MATPANIMEPVNREIISDLKTELRLQGHYLTGALEASLRPRIDTDGKEQVLTASAAGYLEDLEKGKRANEISMDAKSIADMTRYVKLRMGYTGNRATQVAIAILRKQQKEGMPTAASYQYSQTGERKFAVEDTFYNHQAKYTEMLDNGVFGDLDKSFHKTKSGKI